MGATEAFTGAVLDGEQTLASVITKTEILGGMRTCERLATRRRFEQLDWVPVDDARERRTDCAVSHRGCSLRGTDR